MRIGIVSDTHGVLDPRVLDGLIGCEVIVHAGDVGAAAVLRALRTAAPTVLAVRGNNDVARKWEGSGRELEALPKEVVLEAPGGTAGKARTFGGPSACILTAGPRRWRVEALTPS